MGRGGTMYARAARRAAMLPAKLSRANGTDPHPTDYAREVCPYCSAHLKSEAGRNRHIALTRYCLARHKYETGPDHQKRRREPDDDSPDWEEAPSPPKRARFADDIQPVAGPSRLPDPDTNPTASPPKYNVRNTECPNGGPFVERFPVSGAGAPIGTRRKGETDLPGYLRSCGRLGNRDLFETAEILMTTGLTGAARTKHLKGPMYRWKGKGVWRDDADLIQDINRLPKGPKWRTEYVTVGEGRHKRTHPVYLRDILEVIRLLIGTRRFKHLMRYAPERHWTSSDKKCRVYDEMWSGDWWWKMQYLIRNANGTVVPLIIATDETTMANNPQGAKAHPVYLSIGNISKAARRRPTKRAMILVGYLPVDSFSGVTNVEDRKRYRAELFHRSMEKIFEPLKSASEDGFLAWCADGHLRHIYPVIAACVADWPQQNDIACTRQNGCPVCTQKWKGRGQRRNLPPRDQYAIVTAFKKYRALKRPAVLKPLRLKRCVPFWLDIPHVDIGASLAPDLLHQLYKGMFEHAKDWIENYLGTAEFDRRFKTMPQAQDLRHFKNGVTSVKNWAGRESRDMMRQFLPVVLDAQAPIKLVQLIRALLDFSYLAHGEQLTEVELTEMDKALASFHEAKYILIRNELVKDNDSFDRIAKLHMLGHYTDSIRELGTPDGYSTELPEHLHIIYVKIPWRMSNRRNPLPQMVSYVRRLEAIQIHRTLVDEYYGEREGADEEEIKAAKQFIEDEAAREASPLEFIGAEGGDEGADGDENNEDGEEDEGEVQGESEERSELEYYPRPAISVAKKPTVRRVSGRKLVSSYGASDLIRALHKFLSPKATELGKTLLVLPSDLFDVWHKATLRHLPLSFASAQSSHRDVVRAHPLTRDSAGRVSTGAVFDTALFPVHRDQSGLQRYRAGRVHAIFALPENLQQFYTGTDPLVYLDLFTPFEPDITKSHCLYSTTAAQFNGHDVSMIVPLHCLAAACHIAPDFASPRTQPRFLFNEFYNYFTYLVVANWRRQRLLQAE
ncbi:hypothetical protein FRC12_008982 [Ceratobasidium sp. 428]|nr:hypothetical protein FRC12_008982 [Ceratobasidium sp. 428]